jgi:hypothetical protein
MYARQRNTRSPFDKRADKPRMRSAGRAVFSVKWGRTERVSRTVPYAGTERDETRAAGGETASGG